MSKLRIVPSQKFNRDVKLAIKRGYNIQLLDDVVEDDESVLSLELPHAAKVNKARTETEAKVNLENVFIIVSLFP